ncbi:hypothetical protein [Anaerococcus nagyae]|uniref:hypothetical protein n=1 Tax=Anaerococcus nagyae TaxID=1755241 RepID=UPI0033653B72
MLKLSERIFMNITKNINKIINILFAVCLISVLVIVSSDSLILLLSIPIMLTAVNIDYERIEFLSIIIAVALISYLFIDTKNLVLEFVPIILLTLTLIILSKISISDKGQIAINFLIASIIFIGIYRYQMVNQGLDLKSMAEDLKEIFEQNADYAIADETYELSLAMYPAVLSSLSLIYAVISLKLVRNFMAYRNKGKDMLALNNLRLSKKDALIIIGFAALMELLLPTIFAIKKDFVIANVIWIIASILLLNGMLVYDYIMRRRRSSLSRGMQWFFVIIFFYFFAIMFIGFGLADIFVDFRARKEEV